MEDRECPSCGSKEVEVFAPSPFGYWCKECNHAWDEYPSDDASAFGVTEV